MSLPPASIVETPYAAFMDHAEPALPQELPAAEALAFAFGDVPRLTAALKRGEEAAFTWLHREWGSRISRYSFALAAGDETLASEIAQAAWLRMVRHIRIVEDEQALWCWVACAARHAAVDLRRKGGRYQRVLDRFKRWWCPTHETPGADNAASLMSAMEAALAQLTAEENLLVESRYFAGESLETIGVRLSISHRAVEGRLARLRQRLRDEIAIQLRRQAT